MKTIHIEAFDKSSVDKAIEEVKAIKKEWKRKANLCSEMIAAALADEINKNLSAITPLAASKVNKYLLACQLAVKVKLPVEPDSITTCIVGSVISWLVQPINS